MTEGAARAVGAIGTFLQAPKRLERLEGLRGSARRGSVASLPTVWGELQREIHSLLDSNDSGNVLALTNQMDKLVAEVTAQKELHVTRVEQGKFDRPPRLLINSTTQRLL